MIRQTKKYSLVESISNVAIGYFITFIFQLVLFPLYGVSISVTTNLVIGLWFTILSILRSYAIRRFFNKL